MSHLLLRKIPDRLLWAVIGIGAALIIIVGAIQLSRKDVDVEKTTKVVHTSSAETKSDIKKDVDQDTDDVVKSTTNSSSKANVNTNTSTKRYGKVITRKRITDYSDGNPVRVIEEETESVDDIEQKVETVASTHVEQNNDTERKTKTKTKLKEATQTTTATTESTTSESKMSVKSGSSSRLGIAVNHKGNLLATYDIAKVGKLAAAASAELDIMDTEEPGVESAGISLLADIKSDRYFVGGNAHYNFKDGGPEFGVCIGARF